MELPVVMSHFLCSSWLGEQVTHEWPYHVATVSLKTRRAQHGNTVNEHIARVFFPTRNSIPNQSSSAESIADWK